MDTNKIMNEFGKIAREMKDDISDDDLSVIQQLGLVMVNLDSLMPMFKVLNAEVFMSFIGAALDEYEAIHEGFSTLEKIEELKQIATMVHEEMGGMKE